MKQKQTLFVESTTGMALLAAVGGYLDAYSYTVRGGVLATAQTGNMIFLCVALAENMPLKALSFIIPILSFSAGIAVTHFARRYFTAKNAANWRTYALFFEAAVLILTACILDFRAANALISFMCGIQLTAFRVVNKHAAATTMCTGNLKSAIDALFEYSETKESVKLSAAKNYVIIIAAFLVGAVCSALVSGVLGRFSVLLAAVVLILTAVLHMILD